MLFTHKENLEEILVRHLRSGRQTAKGLLRLLNTPTETYTIQALYVVLRSLLASEVIIKHGTQYSLNEEWRAHVVEQLGTPTQATTMLAEGESVSYVLSSLVHHDLQWKNIVLPLHTAYPHDPIFFYNYHYVWIHLGETRKQSELDYFASFQKDKHNAFSLVGSKSVHDIAVKKKLQNEYVQWSVGAEYFKKTDYLAIFNDYIITTRMSGKLTDDIGACYINSKTTSELEQNLAKLGIEKRTVRLTVERNHEKAKKLRKKLSRDFFVSRELVEKFGLY